MAIATPYILGKIAQEGLVKYTELASLSLLAASNIRQTLIQADWAYMRENDRTLAQAKARNANRMGDKEKIQNLVVPVVMPQVEASVETLSGIFCSKFPMFEFGANPDKADVALQYNAIMQENQTRGGWVRQFNMLFRDGLKYNICAAAVEWCTEKIWTLESDPAYMGGKQGKTKEVLWAGNKIRRMDMYNTFFDTRVPIAEVHTRGEFAGWVELMSRMELKRFVNALPEKLIDNLGTAFESGVGGSGDSASTYNYYEPSLNPEALFNKSPADAFDWMSWAGLSLQQGKIAYKNAYEVKTLYARLIPEDFSMKVPSRNTPQVWKLIVVNNRVLIYAERQSNAHDYLPVVFGQPLEDGLRFQTKSFAKNIEPFQDISSALWNERLASARRRLTDRALYNPLLIRSEDINSPEPNAKIPIRNSMYGRKLEEAYYQIPFHDENSQLFTQEAQMVYSYSQIISGKNNPSLGQFQKGNKNNPEWEDTMQNANSRDKGMARFVESQMMVPIKEILKLNILQYQPSGEIYNTSEMMPVTIDPITLRKTALDFKIADGLLPLEAEMKTDELTVALQTIQATPALQAGYNIVPMFSYIMKERGLEGLAQFEKSPLQQQFEQMQQQWQEAAQAAFKAGQKPPAQPQMPPELIQELQQKAQQQQPKPANAPTPSPTPGPNPQSVAAGGALASDMDISQAPSNQPAGQPVGKPNGNTTK